MMTSQRRPDTSIKKGGTVMKRFLGRADRSERGFTLVELLIVVAVLGVLAAIIVPSMTGVVGHSETKASGAELSTVQAAMNTMMAKEGLSSVTAVTTATNAMTGFPDATYPLSPTYLQASTTNGTYTCTSAGVVSQASTGY